MSRLAEHEGHEYQLPMYQVNPPAYNSQGYHQHSSVRSNPPKTSTMITASNNATAGITPSSNPSTSASTQKSKKKHLQVHWHPSVNERQATKRNHQNLSLLAILLFFSSLTVILLHYSGCEIATGRCPRRLSESDSSSLPALALAYGRKRLQNAADALGTEKVTTGVFGEEGLPMDRESMMTAAGSGRRYRAPSNKQWNALNRSPKSIQYDTGSTDQSDVFDHGDSDDQIMLDLPALESDADTDYFEDNELAVDDEEAEAEELTVMAATARTSATPQEAYVEIWKEVSEPLSEDDYLELEEDSVVLSKTEDLQQRRSINNRLDPDTKYMTYLPDAELTNQFHSMLHAAMLSKSLGRTLILPPITGSSQESSQENQPWSSYFDLETFMHLTGINLIEFQDVREPDRLVVASESLKCHITGGVGSLRPLDFTAKAFLRQWKFDLSMTQFETETSDFNELVPILRTREWEHLLCITNGYNIAVPKKEGWNLFGRYLYFTPAVERFFEAAVRQLNERDMQRRVSPHQNYRNEYHRDRGLQQLQQGQFEREPSNEGQNFGRDQAAGSKNRYSDQINSAIIPDTKLYRDTHDDAISDKTKSSSQVTQPIGPFIAIHARRGDFVEYCQQHYQHALESCLPTTQGLASTLHRLLVADQSLRGLPVYVSTNEDRSEELAEFRALGWHVLDHQAIGSRERLGAFGAAFVDQIFMAEAKVLIGVRSSAVSWIGAYRQEDWHGRRAVFM
ncbi:GDP-fucose protein O-fucosyltransferase-domain-containing protein [Dissophora ornata]|nr:hypothetical protein BGZ58_006169 [Dissophora ornata]KAI8604584.1 GDP-fucose protein O-fucosyltransferase-domain-containing protein [Dissophora ornata]